MDIQLSDDELYKRYLKGDAASGDALMLKYGDMLMAYLTSFTGNECDAEDLMLDCFTVILVDKPKIGDGAFKAYLFKVARHKACRLYRKKVRLNEFELPEDIPEKDSAPEKTLLERERDDLLRKCLERIAPQYRETLWLIFFLGLSYEEASKVLGCGKKRIDNLLSNGKKSLKAELEKEGITDTDI